MVCITNAKVVLENGIIWDGVVVVDNDKIIEVGDARDVKIPNGAEIIDANGKYVGPGFVDIHVHGGGDYMFWRDPENAAKYFLERGETTILATFGYTIPYDEYLKAIDKVKNVMAEGEYGKAIAGFYMEGPYMNPKFGSEAWKNQWQNTISEESCSEFVNRAGDAVKVWAVAPERENIEVFMEYAKKVNPDVVFAFGHSEATAQQCERLKKYGIRLETHCTNAIHTHSEWGGTLGAGVDEFCFLNPDMYAEMICDSMGIHVNSYIQRIIMQHKGLDKVVLISDGVVSNDPPPAGKEYITDLSFDANGGLNGSKLSLDLACRNIMHHTNCGIAQAFLMASTNPAKAIGMGDEVGSIAAGKKANLVFVDDMFNVSKVMFEGKLINK